MAVGTEHCLCSPQHSSFPCVLIESSQTSSLPSTPALLLRSNMCLLVCFERSETRKIRHWDCFWNKTNSSKLGSKSLLGVEPQRLGKTSFVAYFLTLRSQGIRWWDPLYSRELKDCDKWTQVGHKRSFWPPWGLKNLPHKKQQLGSIISWETGSSIKSLVRLSFVIVVSTLGIWLYHRMELSGMTFPWCKISLGNSNSPSGTIIRLNDHKGISLSLKPKEYWPN